ncbi:TetR/AcrR family transcriptional regulator [Streptomyces sp. ET3-23]|uniref:TetR/AcrR family transcriptional regulator n=1 Tax=Streptomyces sp. ET3-23 TaxID=2885643 RepID=UPI001D10F871|nr:TetR/AcrR family transcriptional regulator [Streptomyces sp. ET3-23]MCC2278161.1 TetR/AcrR family transcriptional regulator [Streptomyces sp. ET3-23]
MSPEQQAPSGSRKTPPAAAPQRRRDAGRTRERLLDAAQKLFAERGFDRTTTREIGERAGADPALIARYFGGKPQLYLATLRAMSDREIPADLLDEERLLGFLRRITDHGPGPVTRATVVPYSDPVVQEAARTQLYERLVDPLSEHFVRDGVPGAQLRAELAVAALTGIVLARHAGALTELAAADPGELLGLVRALLGGAARPAGDGDGDEAV